MTRAVGAALAIAVEACAHAGQLLRSHRPDPTSSTFTRRDGVTTDLDHLADDLIQSVIRRSLPDAQILSEESSPHIHALDLDGPLWIVDPVDGSSNLLHGLPQVGVSVAYGDRGSVLAGAVYLPFFDELYTAVRGEGARCGHESLAVSDVSTLAEALVGTGVPHDRSDLDPVLDRFGRLMRSALDLRRSGCPTLDICWVARGLLGAHAESLRAWDIAAATLIATEAGAVRIDPEDPTSRLPRDLDGDGFIISAPGIAEELLAALATTELGPRTPR